MTDYKTTSPATAPRRNWLGIIIALAACMAFLVVGFFLGRAAAVPPLLPVASAPQVVEVTRLIVATSPPDSGTAPEAGDEAAVVTATVTAVTATPPAPTAIPTLPTTPTPRPTLNSPVQETISEADFALFYEVWELIGERYDGLVPADEEVLHDAIAGSLETLGDDYTRYVPPDVAERMRDDLQGSVEGIGAFVRENDEGLFEIVRPIEGQPADLVGLLPGDIIIGVDGESVIGASFDEVILKVRGPQGTPVTVTVAREGAEEPLEFTIIRTRFEVPVLESEMLPAELTGGALIGYVHLTEFNSNAEEKLLEALASLLAQNPAGLIFDLRDNPGGLLDQSVAVADVFMPEGVVLFERNIRGLDETFRAENGDAAETIPLVVLVNEASASASEIVAGAIQDSDRAIVIGSRSFGKGSVQQVHTLSDGSELRVTIARWYTPNDHTIDGQGITPDIEVESPLDLGGPEDGQLMRAIEYLLNGS